MSRRLARNAALSVTGQAVIALCGLAAIPVLISALGATRFGLIALCWALLQYTALFDLGVGRALTQSIARRSGTGEAAEIPSLIACGLRLALGVGAAGALLMALSSAWLISQLLRVPEPLQPQALQAFYLIAASIPVSAAMSALRGALEGYQRFDLVTLARVPALGGTFLAPLAVAPFSDNVALATAAMVLVRAAALVAFWLFCRRESRGPLLASRAADRGYRSLLRFGGWVSVSNLVSPLMDYMDRFLIGALLPIAVLAYYTASYELVTKLVIFATAVIAAFFPAFAVALAEDASRVKQLFHRALMALVLTMFPAVWAASLLADHLLALWIGAEAAAQAGMVMRIFAIGVLANSLAQLPFALVQSTGRADITAKLHLVELPAYLLAAWWLIGNYGLEGAAMAWTLRVSLDAVLLFVFARRLVPDLGYTARGIVGTLCLGALAALPVLFEPLGRSSLAVGLVCAVAATGLLYAFAWLRLLAPEDRAALAAVLVQKR